MIDLKEGKYYIGEVPALDIAAKYGTPVYVYDAGIITRQYQRLMKAIPIGNLQLNFAMKALGNINVVRLIHLLGGGIDAVSIGEVELALHAGVDPDKIIFTPSSVGLEELEEVLDKGIRIHVDSLYLLEKIGLSHPHQKVGIRINPHVMAGGNEKISVGHKESKFGVSISYLDQIIALINRFDLQIEGVHIHTGSDILDVEDFMQAIEVLLEAAKQFKHLKYIDFGSGFKVKYKPNDYETDIEYFGQRIAERFKLFCRFYGADLQMIFEPGKFLVSEAGYLIVTVNGVKEGPSSTFVGVNSGFNHLIRPMFYNAYHHIVNLSRISNTNHKYTVVGYICETDTFAKDRIMSEIKPGDILCFLNAGAYAFTMASQYNARYRPPEVLVLGDQHFLIREREKFADLLKGQVEVVNDDWLKSLSPSQ